MVRETQQHVAVLTTVYPQVGEYLDMFLATLEKQTLRNFDLVIVNDGIDSLDALCEQRDNLACRLVDGRATPASNREAGIRYCLNAGYEYVIFADADDYFDPTRVAVSIAKMRSMVADCVVNDVHLVTESAQPVVESYFSRRLTNNQFVRIDDIMHGNIFGLSNTAVRTTCLSGVQIDADLVAVDWYLFTVLLLRGCRAVFTNEANTFYRQHSSNTVGLGAVTIESVKRAVSVKSGHYSVLAARYSEFTELSRYYTRLAAQLTDEGYMRKYFSKCLEHLPEYPFWWEEAGYLECADEY